MTELAALLEATDLAQFLKRSRWVYPFVNAGHVFGIALLVGAVLPMDVSVLRGRRDTAWLRQWAMAGACLAVACGALLFITQATEYIESGWFRAKMALLSVALANAALHLRFVTRNAALASLLLWPTVLLAGRMIAYG